MFRSLALAAVLVLATFHSQAQSQALLKHKVLHGTSGNVEASNLINQTLTINGMELKTDVDSGYTITTTVGKANAEGRTPKKVQFKALRINLAAPGSLTLNFDSSINLAKSDSPQLQPILEALKVMATASFTMLVDADDKCVAIEGLEEIVKNAPDGAAPILKERFNEELLKREHQQSVERYPATPVKVGDTWERVEAVDLGSGQTMKVGRKFEYLGTEVRTGRTLDKISAPDVKVLSFEVAENNSIPFKVTKTDLTVAESKSTVWFDREAGVEVDADRVMHIKGKMTLSINGAELPTDVDLRIETTSRVKP